MLWEHGILGCLWLALRWWATYVRRVNEKLPLHDPDNLRPYVVMLSVAVMLGIIVLMPPIPWVYGVPAALLTGLPIFYEMTTNLARFAWRAACWLLIPPKESHEKVQHGSVENDLG
jgi:hypothetical protein